MITLPSGVKVIEASDNATVANHNVNADLLDVNVTKINAATAGVTADTLMKRDAGGRAKIAAPVAGDDIARKDTVDAVQTSLSGHAAVTTGAHGAVSAATANTLMQRDASGRVKVAAPAAADDVARLDTVTAGDALKVSKAGDTMTGPLTMQQTIVMDSISNVANSNSRSIRFDYVNSAGTKVANSLLEVNAAGELLYTKLGVISYHIYSELFAPHLSGSYTGNGAATRDIVLPFAPTAAIVFIANDSNMYTPRTGGIVTQTSPITWGNSFTLSGSSLILKQIAGEAGPNINGSIYNYIIFR